MTVSEISESLRQFLMVFVHTFEQLEILLLLHGSKESLTAEQIEGKLKIPSDAVAAALAGLVDNRLLRRGDGANPSYQYLPSAALGPRVDELAHAYTEMRIPIVRTVSSNAIIRVRTSAIKTFAEAFMLGKARKKDG